MSRTCSLVLGLFCGLAEVIPTWILRCKAVLCGVVQLVCGVSSVCTCAHNCTVFQGLVLILFVEKFVYLTVVGHLQLAYIL